MRLFLLFVFVIASQLEAGNLPFVKEAIEENFSMKFSVSDDSGSEKTATYKFYYSGLEDNSETLICMTVYPNEGLGEDRDTFLKYVNGVDHIHLEIDFIPASENEEDVIKVVEDVDFEYVSDVFSVLDRFEIFSLTPERRNERFVTRPLGSVPVSEMFFHRSHFGSETEGFRFVLKGLETPFSILREKLEKLKEGLVQE